jgi:minor extracellular serine protease Vpr
VAGAVALLLEARPNTPAQAVRSILQNSATPRPWWGNPGLGFLDNVHRQGAGLLQVADAIRATSLVLPGKLSLGEFETGAAPVVRTLTVKNEGPAPVVYDLGHRPGLTTGGSTFSPSFFSAAGVATFSVPSVTVPAGGTATVDVTFTPPVGPDRGQFGGWVVLTPQDGGAPLRVPYAGFRGDYQSIRALTPTGFGFPWLSRRNPNGTVTRQPDGTLFTMQDDDIPYITLHLDHQVRELRMDVVDALTGKSWHRAYSASYLGRSAGSTSALALPWDGSTTGGGQTYQVPSGQYVIKLTVRKALGDPANPDHVETWTSPVITVARP